MIEPTTMYFEKIARYRFAFWIIAPLVLFLPFLWINPIMFFGNWDSIFYNNILALTSDALRSGNLYPRWFAAANNGYGSPVMMFYAPLAYLITAFITLPLNLIHADIAVRFLTGIYASQILSGYICWLWLKRHFTHGVALAGSLIFVLMPYKFIYIYKHFNLAQLWALAFLPFWMIAAEKLLHHDRRASVFYALAFALVYYTHPLTIIAFGAVPLCYVLWFGRGEGCIKLYAQLALAHMLGIGLCLMQAVPQYNLSEFIYAEEFLAGKFAWQNNLYHIDIFLCANYGIIAALVAYAMQKIPALRRSGHYSKTMFWVSALAIVLFLNLPISAFIWRTIPLLPYLQFPAARLHSVALMAITYLSCVWLSHHQLMLPLGPLLYRKATQIVLISAFGIAILLRVQFIYSTQNSLDSNYVNDAHAARIIVPQEYKTRWGCIDPATALKEYRTDAHASLISTVNGVAENVIEIWNPSENIVIISNVRSDQAVITVRQCYFPGWVARDSKNERINLTPADSNGTLQMTLPKGQHSIHIKMEQSFAQTAALYGSLLTFSLCFVLYCWPYDGKKATKSA